MLISAYGARRTSGRGRWRRSTRAGEAADAPANVSLPSGDYASVFYPVAQEFAGVAIKDLFQVLIITGSFACSLAFWNTANRYLFSMGREGILPRVLGRTHATHKSPFVAAVIVLLFCIMVTLALRHRRGRRRPAGGSRRHARQTRSWRSSRSGRGCPSRATCCCFPIMALCDMAILVYFLKAENRDGFHWFKTLVAPIIGAGSLAFAVFLMLQNRGALTTGREHGLGVRGALLRARDLPGRLRARRHLLHLVREATL